MPQLVDERTLLSNMVPNNGDMAAVAELDPRTWQGQLRRNKLSAFVDPYQSLMPDPNSTYGTLVPAARDNATGEMRFALPTMLRDIGIGGLDALAGRQVGELTPLATGAISALPFGGVAPSGSIRAGAALRTQRVATPRAAVEAARTASTNSARQAWVWKTPEGKFLVNAGDRPEGAKLVGRAIGDEWFSGPGLMAKAGSKEVAAAEAAGGSLSEHGLTLDDVLFHGKPGGVPSFDKPKGFFTDSLNYARGMLQDRHILDAEGTDPLLYIVRKADVPNRQKGHWFSDSAVDPVAVLPKTATDDEIKAALMAKSGNDSVGAAQVYGKSVANINIPEGAATNLSQLLPSRMPRNAQETFFPLQSIKHGATPEQSALILKRLQERAGNDEFFNRMLYLEKRYEDSKLPGSVERLTPEELQELKMYTDNWYNRLGREDPR